MFYTMYVKPDDVRQERPKYVAVLNVVKVLCLMVKLLLSHYRPEQAFG
jgi:hypothetical protein